MIIEELALAKLNLTLGVLYKREDGYHALDTVMRREIAYRRGARDRHGAAG